MRIHSSFPLEEFFSGTMVLVLSSCWISVVNFLFSTFGYLIKYLFSRGTQNGSEKEESSSIPGKGDGYADSFDNSSIGSNGVSKDVESEEESSTGNVLKYCFLAQKDFTGFVDEPQVTNFSIKESFVDWKSDEAEVDDRPNAEDEDGFMSMEEFHQELSETEELGHGEVCSETASSEAPGREVESEISEVLSIVEDRLSSNDRFFEMNIDSPSDFQVESTASVERGIRDIESYDFVCVDHEDDTDIESTASNAGFPPENNQTYCFKSEIEDASSQSDDEEMELVEEQQQTMKEGNSATETEELDCSSATEPADELLQTNKTNFENISNSLNEALERQETAAHLENSLDSDGEEDSGGMEALWEHEDLIEQLKIELKKMRGTTLPTILEEPESPTSVVDDLKPWKMEEEQQQQQQQQEDPTEELQKFHDRYREKMKKLDVLNYQKMHAMGFLQRMDRQLPSIAGQKTSSLRLLRRRKSDVSDHSSQLARELEYDLETIYVGQTCLSWELLHWQYLRSQDLPESDARGRRRQYNRAAGELQQFQVLLQRFVENEEFQGPRIRYYVQSRCVLQNLLQVPLIKEDSWNEMIEGSGRGDDDIITSSMLAEIMEESMRIFWEFLRADKDEAPSILKGFLSLQAELQDPSDAHLLASIQADLQKKEKRVKDLLRSANCIVKRFQKHQGSCSDLSLLFSQIDLKLVGRVLRMSRITSDQLLWCHKKLSNITFKNRKLHREPSFLLFPC